MVGSRAARRLTTVLLTLFALLWIIPIAWMVSMSFQPNDLLARTTSNTALGLIPIPFTVDNYTALLSFGNTPRWFLNSMIVATGMTALVLILSTLAGYAFARIPFRGRTVLYRSSSPAWSSRSRPSSSRSTRCSPTGAGTTATRP